MTQTALSGPTTRLQPEDSVVGWKDAESKNFTFYCLHIRLSSNHDPRGAMSVLLFASGSAVSLCD